MTEAVVYSAVSPKRADSLASLVLVIDKIKGHLFSIASQR